jgi:hypothetical protein
MTDTPSDPPQYQPQPGQPGGYPAGGYPQGGYPAAGGRRNGIGVAALVFGVVALVLVILLLFSPLGALLGLVAVLLGIIGLVRANRGEADNRGQAVAWFATHVNDFRRFGNCMDQANTPAAREQCGRQLSTDLQ